jgi:LacI family transcriptional regulator
VRRYKSLIATVSIVMSRSQDQAIPLQTVDRVMQVARELGYVPNRQAQALKTKRTRTLACVVPDVTNPFYPSFVRGVQSIADAAGYDVIALDTDGSAERERRFLDWSLRGTIDGVVGVFLKVRATDFDASVRAGLAVVRIEASAKRSGPFTDRQSLRRQRGRGGGSTRYLIARGHQGVAMIVGSGGPERNRIGRYLQALGEIGYAPQVVSCGAFNQEGGHPATIGVLNAPRRPTAIFAGNDLMALGAMAAIQEAGLKVPDDIALMGFDDTFAASICDPAALDGQPTPIRPGPGRHRIGAAKASRPARRGPRAASRDAVRSRKTPVRVSGRAEMRTRNRRGEGKWPSID